MVRSASIALVVGAVILVGCDDGSDGVPDAPPLTPGTNLTIDGPRAERSARVVWQYFDERHCAIIEGCVASAGWRRLLRFETFTPNLGDTDLRMGPPEEHPELFEYSACHRHYHFEGYASYELVDGTGALVATGHKQAFCLMDSEPVSGAPGVPRVPQYDCTNQGISGGWGDNYDAAIDCQWVDVTDVEPGDYLLRIAVNEERTISESTFDDNVAMVSVTIPDDASVDPLLECDRPLYAMRDCGWTVAGSFDCEPGRGYEIGCGAGCGPDACGGTDPIMRVCEGDAPCLSRTEIAYADDGCGEGYCPLTRFTCPPGGRYTVMTAPYRAGTPFTCTPGARLAP